jgi:hypothetical protein
MGRGVLRIEVARAGCRGVGGGLPSVLAEKRDSFGLRARLDVCAPLVVAGDPGDCISSQLRLRAVNLFCLIEPACSNLCARLA